MTRRPTYTYDRNSNRTAVDNLAAQAAGQPHDWLYQYDGLNRLIDAQRGDNSGSTFVPAFAQQFALDATGNWAQFDQDDDGSGTWELEQTRTHNVVNEITAITEATGQPQWVTPAYDRAGNTTTMPQPRNLESGYTTVYDAWNRLVRVETGQGSSAMTVAEYEYDGRNFRTVARTYEDGELSETRHSYYTSGWQLIEERLGDEPDTADAERQFIWGLRYIDELIRRDRFGETASSGDDEHLYAVQDANFNVVALYDPSTDDVVERYTYTPYGEPTVLDAAYDPKTNNDSEYGWEIRYCGYRYDIATGLYCVRNRIHHGQTGRWLQRDPQSYVDGLNLYVYAICNPGKYIDSSGGRTFDPNNPDAGGIEKKEVRDGRCIYLVYAPAPRFLGYFWRRGKSVLVGVTDEFPCCDDLSILTQFLYAQRMWSWAVTLSVTEAIEEGAALAEELIRLHPGVDFALSVLEVAEGDVGAIAFIVPGPSIKLPGHGGMPDGPKGLRRGEGPNRPRGGADSPDRPSADGDDPPVNRKSCYCIGRQTEEDPAVGVTTLSYCKRTCGERGYPKCRWGSTVYDTY